MLSIINKGSILSTSICVPAYYKDLRTSLGKRGGNIIYSVVLYGTIGREERDPRLYSSFDTNHSDY